jgi:hypothetical protein
MAYVTDWQAILLHFSLENIWEMKTKFFLCDFQLLSH